MNNKKKLSIVDLAIILAFICVVGGIVFRTYTQNNFFGENSKFTVEYTVKINGSDKELRKLINDGDILYRTSDNSYWGTIVNCNRTASTTYEKGNDLTMISVVDISAIDITLTVRVDALKTKTGYCINSDTFIAPGMKQRFSTDRCEFDGLITGISVPESNDIG